MAQAPGAKVIKLPSSVFEPPPAPPKPTDSSSRKCWPDQKYVVKLPSAEEMEELRRRRQAAGVKIGALPATISTSAPVPKPKVKVSKADEASLKQSSELKKEGTVLKVPTAEAIAALQRRRAAAKKAAETVQATGSALRSDGLVDYCAMAREATQRSKAAAHINTTTVNTTQVDAGDAESSVYHSFLRNKPAADPELAAKRKAAAEKAAQEAAILRQRRAEAAKASQTEGKTVRVPSASEIEALRKRREAAAVVQPTAPQPAPQPAPMTAESAALKQRRAEAAKAQANSGSTVRIPDQGAIEAMQKRRAAAQAAQKPAPKPAPTIRTPTNSKLSVYQKLQLKQQEGQQNARGNPVPKRTAPAGGDLRSLLNKRSRT